MFHTNLRNSEMIGPIETFPTACLTSRLLSGKCKELWTHFCTKQLSLEDLGNNSELIISLLTKIKEKFRITIIFINNCSRLHNWALGWKHCVLSLNILELNQPFSLQAEICVF